ncbi:hypothetical protein LA080_002793 [Diaporthe eres]|nr:hypothetical protein LA080_002793 [Diaporthe eres]
MAAPRKSEVADKAGNTKAVKAGNPAPQMASTTDNKTAKHKEDKEDGGNWTRKDGAGYRSRSHPYANSFQKYLGWLDSLEGQDEASASNTSTKRYWQKFCQQMQNKKMMASWMEIARNIRTADGLLTFC